MDQVLKRMDAAEDLLMKGLGCPKSQDEENEVVLLGKRYRVEESWREEVAKVLWFTYRNNFPSMEPSGYTDDAGWGCMLRSSQMLMAAALVRHIGEKGRMKIIQWFNDEPGEHCIYSIHNMVKCGLRYDMLPGEWYGPGVAAHVLRDLCEMHNTVFELNLAMTVTSQERPLCEEDLLLSVTKPQISTEPLREEDDCSSEEDSPSLQYDPLLRPPPWAEKAKKQAEVRKKARKLRLESEWQKSALIIIPLRLGLAKLDPKYLDALLATLEFPQSLGFVGGRPRQALYFLGSMTKQLLGLDPHVVQPATGNVFSTTHLDSLVCLQPRRIGIDAIDPSLALAFYCRTRADFLDLTGRIRSLSKLSDPPLFDVIKKRARRSKKGSNIPSSSSILVPSGLISSVPAPSDDDDASSSLSLHDDLLLDDDNDEHSADPDQPADDDDYVVV